MHHIPSLINNNTFKVKQRQNENMQKEMTEDQLIQTAATHRKFIEHFSEATPHLIWQNT